MKNKSKGKIKIKIKINNKKLSPLSVVLTRR